jgi:hypothetical protein
LGNTLGTTTKSNTLYPPNKKKSEPRILSPLGAHWLISLATSYFFYHFWPRLTTGPQIWGHNNVITYIVIITPLFYHNSTMNWQYFHLILGFSIKSGKHGTKSLSLVRNRVRFQKKKPAKKYTLAFNGRSNSEMHHFLCQTEFHPVLTPSFSFFLSASIAATYIFHCSYMYNYYNYLKPCALNTEFQHFIPRFNITSLFCRPHSKRG